jgi:thioredoxin 1
MFSKRISIFSLLFVMTLTFFACQGVAQKEGTINKTIPPVEFQEKIKSADVQLIDVRSEGEFADGGISGATNINWNGGNFEQKVASLDKSKPIMVYCLSGGRSASAARKLNELGFKEVYNLEGGIVRWRSEIQTAAAPKGGMTMADYNNAIKKQTYVLVDFNATWCAPCKKMLPWLTALEEEKKSELQLLKIDADQNAQLLAEKGIKGIPYLELYKNGELIWKQNGLIEEAEFRKQTGL